LARATLEHGHYISALGGLRLALADVSAALRDTKRGGAQSTLRPREDSPVAHRSHRGLIERLRRGGRGASSPAPPPEPGAMGILTALEDDVATYVARNDLRERVRGFVQAALLMILDRHDASVVVNAHSQGSVICWDVLGRLPLFSWRQAKDERAAKLRDFVTAGSPIRKYVDLFAWGELVGELSALIGKSTSTSTLTWTNFWDEHDPVADPLNAAAGWHPGESVNVRPEGDKGLLLGRSPGGGAPWHVEVNDVSVDNLLNSSGGGLQAHDYWNNKSQFVKQLASIL
jgi:hypothetical protein